MFQNLNEKIVSNCKYPSSPPQWALTKLVPINKAAAPTVLTAPPAKKL